MSARDTLPGTPPPDRRPHAPGDPAAATASVPDRSTPGPHRADRATSSVITDDARTPPAAEFDPGLPSIPGYRLVELLGRGGMGTVYRAVHVGMNREVALKLINPGGRDDALVRDRFGREVRALAKIEHPNIVPVYHAGEWQGFPYYTMKLVAGGTLSHHLDRFVGDLPAAVRLVAKVARAVGVLHAARVLHRDLKPLNILLGDNDEPMVADFGLARWIGDDTGPTETGAPVGTRPYMSPEQSLGARGDYTEACDIWALGVILFEVLTGRRPFAAEDTVELYLQIRNEPPPPASSVNPAAPPELEAVIGRCLMKRPEDRYPTADALADDLERWLAGGVIPPAPRQDAPRRPRPRLRWLPVGAVLAAVCAVAAAAALWPKPETAPDSPGKDVAPKRTVVERLAAGETVQIVAEKDLPLVEYATVPGCDSIVSTQREGFCTLTSTQYGAIEFVSEPLPRPMLFEAEVAIEGARPDQTSWGGLYAGRKTTQGGTGLHTTLLHFIENPTGRVTDGPEGRRLDVRQTGSAELVWWLQRPTGRREAQSQHVVRFSQKLDAAPELRWQKWSVRIGPGGIEPTWAGHRFKPITEAQVHAHHLREAAARDPAGSPVFTPPALGPGLGFCVHQADAVFRNVRLVPLDP